MTSSLDLIIRRLVIDLESSRDELNELDSQAGDGDLGVTTGIAASALSSLVASRDPLPAPAALRLIGLEIARQAPSTAGTLIGSACLASARAWPSDRAASANPVTIAASLLHAALLSIQERGHAKVGEKTMLDALAPAVESLLEASNNGTSLHDAMLKAEAAAAAGAEATRTLEPRHGRAQWLSGRAYGNVDAGARLVVIVIGSLAKGLDEAAPPATAAL